MTTIGTRVAHLRENLGLKQKEFAVKCGISPQNISNIEGGDTKPSYDGICAITKAFPNVNITWLIHGEGDMFLEGELADYTPPEKKMQEVLQPNDNVLVIVEQQKQNINYLQSIIDKLLAKVEVCVVGDLIAA